MENLPPAEGDFGVKGEKFNLSPEDLQTLISLEDQAPGLTACLEKITNATTSNDDAFDAVKEFNDAHMNAKEGMYSSFHMANENRQITVKYYKNGSVSISLGIN